MAADKVTKLVFVNMAILFIINMLNYVDRSTILGVLPDLKNGTQNGFDKYLSDTKVALLQTGFVISYMFASPIFGYLGDRFNRKHLMTLGVVLWSFFTAASSLAPTYWALLVLRSMVGIGEASYVTVAPTIIADLFSARLRIRALSVFYIAIPVGTAMGYGVGAGAAKIANETLSKNYIASHDLMKPWRFSLRVTPLLGILCALLILCILKEPPRGQKEGVNVRGKSGIRAYFEDIIYCLKIRSYMLSVFGFAMGTFSIGALTQWASLFMYKTSRDTDHPYTNTETNLMIGLIVILGGLGGTVVGSESAKQLRLKIGASADCYVCAVSLYVGSAMIYLGLTLASYTIVVSLVLMGVTVFFFSLCWAPVTAIILNTVIPERRSTAAGFQVFLSHILGDSFSPLLVGVVSDAIHGDDKSDHAESLSLQKALYVTCFAAAIGSAMFLTAAFFINYDEHQMELYIEEHRDQSKHHSHSDSNSTENDPLISSEYKQTSINNDYSVNNNQSHD